MIGRMEISLIQMFKKDFKKYIWYEDNLCVVYTVVIFEKSVGFPEEDGQRKTTN